MQTNATVDLNRFKNAVGFTATFKVWGNTRKANMANVTTEADKRRLKLSKQLIEADEYDRIKSYMSELRQWIYGRTVPSFFKDGFQLCSLTAVETIESRMKKAIREDLPPLVAALQLAYPNKVEEAKAALADQFKATDYPSEDDLARAFGITWNWIAFTTPEALPPELRQAEEDKLKKQFADAGEQILEALRTSFQELLSHALDRLQPGEDGKAKVFRDSLIGNIQEFLDTFSSRNLMNDTELAALVDKAKTVLTGNAGDPNKIRKLGSVREEAAAKFAEIKTALDGMIETRKARQFDLED